MNLLEALGFGIRVSARALDDPREVGPGKSMAAPNAPLAQSRLGATLRRTAILLPAMFIGSIVTNRLIAWYRDPEDRSGTRP